MNGEPVHGRPSAEVPALWRDFDRQVLGSHHRNGLGAQCVCGRLLYYCPVIAAAERHGLPTDDPGGRQRSTPTVEHGDFLPTELDQLRITATAVINEHLDHAGVCAMCGSPWPCQRAQLAEHNLALL